MWHYVKSNPIFSTQLYSDDFLISGCNAPTRERSISMSMSMAISIFHFCRSYIGTRIVSVVASVAVPQASFGRIHSSSMHLMNKPRDSAFHQPDITTRVFVWFSKVLRNQEQRRGQITKIAGSIYRPVNERLLNQLFQAPVVSRTFFFAGGCFRLKMSCAHNAPQVFSEVWCSATFRSQLKLATHLSISSLNYPCLRCAVVVEPGRLLTLCKRWWSMFMKANARLDLVMLLMEWVFLTWHTFMR